jgi:hypothetical protein
LEFCAIEEKIKLDATKVKKKKERSLQRPRRFWIDGAMLSGTMKIKGF